MAIIMRILDLFGLYIGYTPFGFYGRYCDKTYTLPKDAIVVLSWHWIDRHYIIYKFKD